MNGLSSFTTLFLQSSIFPRTVNAHTNCNSLLTMSTNKRYSANRGNSIYDKAETNARSKFIERANTKLSIGINIIHSRIILTKSRTCICVHANVDKKTVFYRHIKYIYTFLERFWQTTDARWCPSWAHMWYFKFMNQTIECTGCNIKQRIKYCRFRSINHFYDETYRLNIF